MQTTQRIITCDICGDEATKIVNRHWHDGTVDYDLRVCDKHAEDDPEGMWKMHSVMNQPTIES